MPLFEVAIIEKPTPNEEKDGAVEKLVYGPKPVMARNNTGAMMKVVRDCNQLEDAEEDRITILVRPFA
jgi:hypothetical protein